jgi:hypothetical protein
MRISGGPAYVNILIDGNNKYQTLEAIWAPSLDLNSKDYNIGQEIYLISDFNAYFISLW